MQNLSKQNHWYYQSNLTCFIALIAIVFLGISGVACKKNPTEPEAEQEIVLGPWAGTYSGEGDYHKYSSPWSIGYDVPVTLTISSGSTVKIVVSMSVMLSGDITNKVRTWKTVTPDSQSKIIAYYEEDGYRYKVSLSRKSRDTISGSIKERQLNSDGTTFLEFSGTFIVH